MHTISLSKLQHSFNYSSWLCLINLYFFPFSTLSRLYFTYYKRTRFSKSLILFSFFLSFFLKKKAFMKWDLLKMMIMIKRNFSSYLPWILFYFAFSNWAREKRVEQLKVISGNLAWKEIKVSLFRFFSITCLDCNWCYILLLLFSVAPFISYYVSYHTCIRALAELQFFCKVFLKK
jgi:hypothetical protein